MSYPRIALPDAVVLITGGGRGIGLATGEAFLARGASVCLADVDRTAALDSAARIGAHGFGVDVTSRASFDACVADVTARFGRIDVLVNNAGVMPAGAFLDEPDAVSATTLDVNVWGLIHGMRLVLPGMLERGRGHIVNIASMAGKIPIPGLAVYNASKYAALGLTATVRAEFADSGVSISAVLPSAVRTGLTAGIPLGRGLPTVDPEDVARAVVASVRSRQAEIAVPGYLALWDVLDAVVPERLQRLAFGLLGARRALTSIDHDARQDYERRIAAQSAP